MKTGRQRAGASPTTAARRVAAFETALIVGGILVLFFLLPHGLFADDTVRFDDIEQLLHHGHLTDSHYSLVMPLASVPVLLLGKLVESRTWWAARFNVVVVAVGLLFAYRLLRGRIDPRLFRLVVLVLLFASFLTNRLRDYYPEVFTATLVVLGIICLATERHVVAGWTAIVVGVVNTPAAFVGLVLVAGLAASRTRRLRLLTPVVAAAALIMVENWVRRGGPFVTGYANDHGYATIMPYSGRPEFSYPFLLGLAAILFSFGRGLLFFMPGLVLWLDGSTRRLVPGRRSVSMMLLFTAGLVLVYSKWWAWYGGLTWGPRFFVFASIPASLFLATRIRHAGRSRAMDALALAVLVLSAWVATAGAIADIGQVFSFCANDGYANEQLCWFTPDYSSLWQPVRQFPHLTTSTTVVGLYCGVVFTYLAAPLVAGLLRSARPTPAWLRGWRI